MLLPDLGSEHFAHYDVVWRFGPEFATSYKIYRRDMENECMEEAWSLQILEKKFEEYYVEVDTWLKFKK